MTKALSESLKARMVAFHESIPDGVYWWRDPRYLDICAEIEKEIYNA